jgi:hypothetical protein
MVQCSIENDGSRRVCSAHKVELIEQPVVPVVGQNPPSGFGHIAALGCPVSRQTIVEVEGL